MIFNRRKLLRILSASPLAFVASSLTGCHLFEGKPLVDTTPSVGSHHDYASHPVRRVAVLPSEGLRRDEEPARRINAAIVRSLRQCGAFEIIEVPQHELGPCRPHVITDGRYDDRQLVWLMHRFNVDAVMFSKLTHVRLVEPQSWSVTCHIVDVRNSTIISTVEGVWDLANPADYERFQKYNSMHELGILDPELAARSPQVVADFVGKEIAMELY